MSAPTLSFEFYPPRTDSQKNRFWRTLGCLETLSPEFVSVTYGALGSGSEASMELVGALLNDNSIPVAAHLTCSGQTRDDMNRVLDDLVDLGVQHIVALRGDKPTPVAKSRSDSASSSAKAAPVMQFGHELVALIAERPEIDISVAAYPETHPEAASSDADLQHLKQKLDAGATRALTQFFFEAESFLRWRDRAVKCGIDKPLVPGILPIHNIDKVINFSSRCGTHVPSSLIQEFQQASEEDSQRLALEQCVTLCNQLQREGVDTFHLYTLNQSNLAYAVSQQLMGVGASSAAA